MDYVAIGLIVGIIMGLTGAGGAMISIPLFIGLLNTSLKEATVLSLIAVILGTSVNLLGQLSDIHRKIIFPLTIAGAIANYLSLPLKANTPEVFIAALLTLIGVYSIWSVWAQKNQSSKQSSNNKEVLKALTAGAFLGVITTLTGLGGGVILMPILISLFGKSYEEALPTSLASILIISVTAFFFQLETALSLISVSNLGLLGAGAILSFLFLKFLLKHVSSEKILETRKYVFTGVTIYSVVSVIIKVL